MNQNSLIYLYLANYINLQEFSLIKIYLKLLSMKKLFMPNHQKDFAGKNYCSRLPKNDIKYCLKYFDNFQ